MMVAASPAAGGSSYPPAPGTGSPCASSPSAPPPSAPSSTSRCCACPPFGRSPGSCCGCAGRRAPPDALVLYPRRLLHAHQLLVEVLPHHGQLFLKGDLVVPLLLEGLRAKFFFTISLSSWQDREVRTEDR